LLNQVEVEFFQQDILSFLPVKEALYSIIISNPPYIVPSEKELMQANVLSFEPTFFYTCFETAAIRYFEMGRNR